MTRGVARIVILKLIVDWFETILRCIYHRDVVVRVFSRSERSSKH